MKKMKKIGAVILMVVMMASVTGCGGEKDARAAFDGMMQAFQTGEAEKINAYYDFAEVSRFINVEDQAEMLQTILDTLKQMEYRVDSVEKIDGANVKVTATVTTMDFSQVLDRYLEKVIAMVSDESYQARIGSMTQEEYQKLLASQMTETLKEGAFPTTEKTISVTMVKEGGKWVAGGDKDAFLGALFSNLTEAVNSLV